MYDSFKKVAEERLKRKQARKQTEAAGKSGNMLDSYKYEESTGLSDLLKKKKEDEEEEE